MLNKEDELRLASIRGVLQNEVDGNSDYSLPLETIIWLADKTKELQDELKNQPQVVCTGEEVHFHYSTHFRKYSAHSHSHVKRIFNMNSLHHHHPEDHRRSREQ